MPSAAAGGRGRVNAAQPGSSSQAAIELLDEDTGSNNSGSIRGRGQQGTATKGNGTRGNVIGARSAAEPHRRRASERKRPQNVNKPTRPTPTLGPGGTAASAAAARRRRRSESSSSDSDAYVVVAASRAPSAASATGKGTSKRSARQDEPSSRRRRNDKDMNGNGKGKGKGQGKAREKESRRKPDVVNIEEGSEEEEDGPDVDENQTQPGPSKPSFKDRLSQNLHSSPRFSKAFKSKVKSSNSTSMPLADDRFESDKDEEGDGYESADKPSPRKKRASKHSTKQERPGASSSRRSRNASDAENDPSILGSDVECVSVLSSTDDEATAPAAGRRDACSTAEELSGLPDPLTAAAPSGTQAEHRRRSLDKLSASRKEKDRGGHKKDKQKQRIVDSPELSPAPVSEPRRASQPSSRRAVVLDDDEDSENAELPTISPKARRKTSKPLFIGDNEDEVDESEVEQVAGTFPGHKPDRDHARSTRERLGESSKRKKGDEQGKKRAERDSSSSSSSVSREEKKTKKAKARPVASSSSASSSSSADEESGSESSPDATLNRLTQRHEAESEEDVDEELENLKMDYYHVQAEKLRPKDDAKERRLDKLRAARAAKQQREERRKKGIIESDDELSKPGSSQQAPQRVESSSSEDDSDIDSVIPNLDDDDKDFIVQDGTSWEVEKTKVARHLPPEIRFGSRDLEEHFETFISYLVYKYIFANKSWVDESDEFRFALLALEKEINGTINSGIASSIWKEEFRAALDARPELYMREIEYTNGCEGCNKHDRTASQEATISGPTYDRDSFEDDSDEEEPPQVFLLGRFCAEKCVLAHDLKHFQYRTHNRIHELCAENCRLPVKIPGDREERDRVRGKEARRIIKVLGQGNFPEVKQMWAELDQALQRARRGLQ